MSLKALRRRFEEQVVSNWQETKQEWDARTQAGRRLMVNVYPTMVAILDDRIGEGVQDLLARCALAYMNGATDIHCFGCMQPWTADRYPKGVLVVEHIDGPKGEASEMGLVAGLCQDCLDNAAIIVAGLKRDFGARDVSFAPPPGSA
ncbi:MAG: hypothetical protein ABW318_22880 [Vicinamibacterales bacterium]